MSIVAVYPDVDIILYTTTSGDITSNSLHYTAAFSKKYGILIDRMCVVRLFNCSYLDPCWISVNPHPSASHLVVKRMGPEIPSTTLYSLVHGDQFVIKELKVLEDNAALRQQLASINMPIKKHFVTTSYDNSTLLQGFALIPSDSSFDVNIPCKNGAKSPVIMHTYGGPGSQSVTQQWVFDWQTYLASKLGIVTITIDGHGTGGRGQAFRTSVYDRLGDLEAEDQARVAHNLKNMCNVDTNKVMFWGWSFGGFLTLRTLETDFAWAGGIAVAPVSVCFYYDFFYVFK